MTTGNKKRLIYAEDLFEPVDFTVLQMGNRCEGKTMAMYEQLFRKRVELAPTVDAVEVVHGRWIDKTEWIGSFGQIKTECSVCGTIYPHKPGSRGDGKGGKFCEECGAKMDGERKDNAN